MKILILTQGIKNRAAMDQGIALAKAYASTAGIEYELSYKETAKQFHSYPFTNDAVGNGVYVDPNEILAEAGVEYKEVIFIYDWNKIIPPPTNPAQHTISITGCNPIQIPEQWYCDNTKTPPMYFPEVLADYILHEQDHDGHGRRNDGTKDMTHLLNNRTWNPAEYDKWIVKQPHEYYLYLMKQFKVYLDPATSTSPMPTLRFRSPLKESVKEMQNLLNLHGAVLIVDGGFGPKSLSALLTFQKNNGLTADGVCGPKTWAELKKKPL